MGMTPNCLVEILAEENDGCLVRVRGSNIILGCGLAGKIMAVAEDKNSNG